MRHHQNATPIYPQTRTVTEPSGVAKNPHAIISRAAADVNGTLSADKKPFSWTDRDVIIFDWPEKLYLKISRHSDHGINGLILEVGNKRPADTGSFSADVIDGVSWDEENGQFRQSRFKPVGANNGKEVPSGGKSPAQWFIRVTESTPEITLGNGTVLIWPNGDSPQRYIWLLSLKLKYELPIQNKPAEKVELPPVHLLIGWDLATLSMSKYDQKTGAQS